MSASPTSFTQPIWHKALIFTGHMVDAPDRTTPRFPPDLETQAAAAILDQIEAIKARSRSSLVGIASGARGGDVLFHEACNALSIPTILVLPFDKEAFLDRSVRGAMTGQWEERFLSLWQRLKPEARIVLNLEDAADPFGACNDEMSKLAHNIGETVELLALWDGEDAGKPGGTGRFANMVLQAGGKVTRIDPATLAS